MSEELALYIKLSESSLNLDLDLGIEINITYQSHTYRMVFMTDITIISLLLPGPCWHAGCGGKLLSRSRE